MANIEISPAAILQISPNTCENCASSSEIGTNFSSNGSFSEHLNSSLEQTTHQDLGKPLPGDGNELPPLSSLLNSESNFQHASLNLNDIISNGVIPSINVEFESNISNVDGVSELLDLSKLVDEVIEPTKIKSSYILETSSETSLEATAKINDDVIELLPETAHSVHPISTSQRSELQILNTKQNSDDALLDEISNLQKNISAKGDFVNELQKLSSQFQNKVKTVEYVEGLTKSNTVKDSPSNQFAEDSLDFEPLKQKPSFDREILNLGLSTYKSSSTNQAINPLLANDANQRIPLINPVSSTTDVQMSTLLKQNIQEKLETVYQNAEQSLNQNIKWLINNKVQNAKINLYPETLGHVNVSLNLEDSKLTINFIANTVTAREIIEANLSSLKNNLDDSGILLEEATVSNRYSDHAEHQSQNSEEQDEGKYNHVSYLDNSNINKQLDTQERIRSLNLVDAYA